VLQVEVIWVVAWCCVVLTCLRFHPEDEDSTDRWNVGILPQHHTASQPRKPRHETSPPWKPRSRCPIAVYNVNEIHYRLI